MLNIGHLMTISLDGDWNFQLLDRPDQEPSKRWQTIPVPGLWTMINGEQPFGDKPIYTNVQMPFDHLPPLVPTNVSSHFRVLGKTNASCSLLVDLNRWQ
jgi:beta-galactosidase